MSRVSFVTGEGAQPHYVSNDDERPRARKERHMTDRSHAPTLSAVRASQDQSPALKISRLVSILLAVGLLVALAFFPRVTMQGDALLTQTILPVLLIGLGATLAHGLGWRPRSSILAAVVGPFVAWPLMVAAFAFLALGGGSLV